jgi:hypothetical protein
MVNAATRVGTGWLEEVEEFRKLTKDSRLTVEIAKNISKTERILGKLDSEARRKAEEAIANAKRG